MITTHNLGFPRIGAQRELKWANESYWRGCDNPGGLFVPHPHNCAAGDAVTNIEEVDYLPWGFLILRSGVGYKFLVGEFAGPQRHRWALDNYFRAARGRAACAEGCIAGEMTKWFDTNYHYIVPEFTADAEFSLQLDFCGIFNAAQSVDHLVSRLYWARLSYLWLGKSKDGSENQPC